MTQHTDVFVIGAGPAGLAAAIAGAKKGFKVTVADGAEPPIEKACGEGLLPGAVRVLKELGIEFSAADGFRFRGIQFFSGEMGVKAEFPFGEGMGARRIALHQRMIEQAQRSGVNLLWRASVIGIGAAGVSLWGRTIGARWIVGADGIRSRVRLWAGLDRPPQREPRYAFRRHYHVRPWSEYTEVHWGRNGQAYVTPVGAEDVCVVLVSRDPQRRFASLAAEFPRLAERLSGAHLTTLERGAVTLSHSLDRVYQGPIALVGDASGTVDAITGEGLSLGFHQALALADALEAGDLRAYRAAHRRIARRPMLMGRLLLLLDGRPKLRDRAMRAWAAHPELFARLLAAHVGQTSARDIAATGAALGWRLATV